MTQNVRNSSLKTKKETRVLKVYDNTSEFAVKINVSKAKLIYSKYIKATNGGTVLSFFGSFLSCLTTLLTASFNDILGIEKSSYFLSAFFLILTLSFGIITIVLFTKWIYNHSKLNEESFINELKGGNNC